MLEIICDGETLKERFSSQKLSVVQFASNLILDNDDAQLITFVGSFTPQSRPSLFKTPQENNERLLSDHGIDGLPTYIFYKNGTELTRLVQPTVDVVETEICNRLKDERQLKKLKTAQLNDPASEEAASTASKEQLNKSSSNMSKEFVSEVIGVDINNIPSTVLPEKLIKLSDDNLTELNEVVFNEMRSMVEETEFPKNEVPEAKRQLFVIMMIRKLVKFVWRKHNLRKNELKWTVHDKFQFNFLGVEKDIIPDILLYSLEDTANATTSDATTSKVRTRKKYLAVIECKKKSSADGLKQALVYLRKIYELNADRKTVYGFSTDSNRFEFLSYDEDKGFRLCTSLHLNFLFPSMFEEKQDWLDNCTKILRVVYSVLCKRLDLPRN